MISQILTTTLHLPPRIQAICWIQFWSWIGEPWSTRRSSPNDQLTLRKGWFPFLFYSTTWVGETYFRYDAPQTARESKDTLGDIGRVGSLSLIAFSIITFAGSVLLPWLIRSPDDEQKARFTPRPPPSIAPLVTTLSNAKPDLATAWMLSHLVFAASMALAPFVTSLRFATTLVAICGMYVLFSQITPLTRTDAETHHR